MSKATRPQWIRVTADGHDAVIVQVFQQPGGNTVQIALDCKKKLKEFRSHLPAGLKIANWYDQSELILASAASVRDAVLIGLIFAVLILWLFLRNVKMTLIAAIMVPSVLAATIFLLKVFHMSFNIMTLGGLAAAVGLIIDDMIVMEEHIVRRLVGRGEPKNNIALSVREMTKPLAGSSTTTTIIFLPLAFLTGVTGAFFKALSLTMASSLIVSYLVAWLGVPLLAGYLLKSQKGRAEESGMGMHGVLSWYQRLMKFVLDRPLLVLPVILALVGVGWLAYRHLGSGFMPKMDEGGFILDYRTSAGTSLTETDRLLRQVEDILRQTPEVQTYSRRTGLSLGGSITEANEGDFFVRLNPPPRRSIETVMDEVRTRIERLVPGIEVEMAQLMEDLIGDLTAVPQPIEIKLFSDDEGLLRRLAPNVADAIRRIPGVVDVKDGIVLAGDAIVVHVDRDKASLEGIRPEAVTAMLSHYLHGVVTTHIQQTPKMVGVRVWIPEEFRTTEKDIEALRLRAADGHIFPLKRIARVEVLTGQPQITRDDLKLMVAVTGRISGRDMGSVIHDVKKVLERPGLLPKGVYYELGGLYRQQQIAFKGLVAVFLAAVVLVFLVLLFLYESFRIAFCVIINTLFSLSAVFVGLWLTGTEINISSMMGMTMIIGIVTETAIFFLSEYSSSPKGISMKEAMILAGRNRMRPIGMTTVAAILALMPLALGIGQGAAMLRPLAISIISGLFIQFPLVLVVLPVLMYVLMGKRDAVTSGE
ncbi:Cobalt-zinc-cadmium resistance protein CzcA/CusA [Dissulfuribacter thermophilus]|uniref:Cobalt-zinc-cadmium resistance protein CzcA/CusA n=1 Tax=Dissulfuribacter thermophilus TaxID=1156395 RepID=A0A1B9F6Q4_9BACT|nr:efflux RND transporter permease subunit [Dissulfuribacter thermophilus]OCC15586.1 Cobalt-zinc-cadmium resistance protein CzcA/CusA [Dissulfuribacter thermophilus]